MKTLWHEIMVDLYLHKYNQCSETDHQQRSILIKKVFHHQDHILKRKVAKHTKKAESNMKSYRERHSL
ncbi:hypothetical protein [Alteribacter aurantiacus]|uniref:hypothetical protein n=1 Tax=Alteribacter aurantiacus TaxID=254410 RepID=UPI00041F9623|nr:hypothetical protein [Alteribacter aurantiacus]